MQSLAKDKGEELGDSLGRGCHCPDPPAGHREQRGRGRAGGRTGSRGDMGQGSRGWGDTGQGGEMQALPPPGGTEMPKSLGASHLLVWARYLGAGEFLCP